jgi:Putative beta-barrel porin-2, OmpL-like. bbp2
MFHPKIRLLCSLVSCASIAACSAQNTTLPANNQSAIASQDSQPSPDASPRPSAAIQNRRTAAILKELEAMKERIAQLEEELKSEAEAGVPAQPPERPVASAPQAVLPTQTPSQAAPSQAAAPEEKKPAEPFSFADFTWLTGNPRTTESPLDTKVFTGELRVDTDYVYDFNHPADHSIGGSSEVFRSGEVQLTQFGVGGDFHWNNVRGRLMTQFGMYAETTPRNDASPARGQWDLPTAYRYLSEACGGYHFNKWNGINVDAGIFLSYIGLFSYYQFDNWAYQPSYVSSNTPWFFNGVRVQIFPSEKLKIEPWFVNGWQSYGKFNKAPGFGLQIQYRPNGWLSILGNQYTGTDTLGIPGRRRIHTDDSIQVKYYDNPARFFDKAAMTLTVDAGCEFGSNSGVSCYGGNRNKPSQYFLGFMAYERFWFHKDLFAFTLGGGAINNPGRYLVLLPPIDGATAITGTPISQKIRETSTKPGTPQRHSTMCRSSSSPGASSTTIVQLTCRTSLDQAALRLRVAITVHLDC